MSNDPYDILGVSKDASQDEIKKAYRRLAKSLHPDLHPDDPGKQAEFQAVSAAYDLLRDAEKRRRFDAGEIDASGQERPQPHYYHHYASENEGRRYDGGPRYEGFSGGFGRGTEDMSDLYSELFGRRARGGGTTHQEFHRRGPDLRYHLSVDFLDAVRGAKRTVTMPDGRSIELTVPAGVSDGQVLRLRGKGGPGNGDGPPGDAFVTIAVKPHPVFSRDGDNIEMELPITVDEAVLGHKVDVPTVSGPVSMTIPEGASSGQRLRLKGKGVQRRNGSGDQMVRLKIVLPKKIDDEMRRLAERWRKASDFDPRADLRRMT
ncbi:DnaJ C-terminal domain-containing protein [Jannaschia seohaensis]|uniref:DnaJ-class molecular chaperone n=1 Tax=Jannaschia seohaensis TaxID=475081 RepID=A0A2Y9B011_9RHOB|nr:DnaJ C-terminal domain-containing protein [Jannaschia seohaensis]PWJ14991.1 DnaJ-class molecular chaperone [Jannaschia seohaensis]SSA49840.1 DnaJ-class molecular chaperone with C-terminal Zn finger domain [Jannaschia seohaensis]